MKEKYEIFNIIAKAIETCENVEDALYNYNLAKQFVEELTKNKSNLKKNKILHDQVYPMADYIINHFN